MRRILLVDDSEEWRSILAIALRTIPDVDVLTAESGEQAIEIAAVQPVDVVVTDFRMGGMTGLELLSHLRRRARWPTGGAVVVSGEQDPDLPQDATNHGADAFFAKPFSPAEIRKCVLSLLTRRYGMA